MSPQVIGRAMFSFRALSRTNSLPGDLVLFPLGEHLVSQDGTLTGPFDILDIPVSVLGLLVGGPFTKPQQDGYPPTAYRVWVVSLPSSAPVRVTVMMQKQDHLVQWTICP